MLKSLAHQIYPRGRDERIETHLADELKETKTKLAATKADNDAAQAKVVELQKQIDDLNQKIKDASDEEAKTKPVSYTHLTLPTKA